MLRKIHQVNIPLYQERKQQLIVLSGEKQGVYFWKTGQKNIVSSGYSGHLHGCPLKAHLTLKSHL